MFFTTVVDIYKMVFFRTFVLIRYSLIHAYIKTK